MKAWIFVLAAAACRDQPSRSSSSLDALWQLEPASATFGVVVSPSACVMIEHAWHDVAATTQAIPELALVANAMLAAARDATGGDDFTLAAFGMTDTRGFALFAQRDGQPVAVLPVTDRDKFLARVHGTRGDKLDKVAGGVCKLIKEVYACAETEPTIDALGTGDGHLKKLLDTRGDIEIAGDLPGGADAVKLAVVGELSRGAVTLRGTIDGVPQSLVGLAPAPMKARFESDSTGFALATAAKPLSDVLAHAVSAIGSDLPDPTAIVADPITITTHATTSILDLRVPLRDPSAAQKFLATCGTPQLADAGFTSDANGCHWIVPNIGAKVDVWIDDKTLRFGDKRAQKGTATELTPLGKELASGAWNFVMWGRGTLYSPSALPIPDASPTPTQSTMIRGMSLVSEVGFGARLAGRKATFVFSVRTVWSNPDDVVAKLGAIPAANLVGGTAGSASKAIADGAPSSPFAGDFKAGYTGLMLPMTLLGTMSAIAIPAFEEFMRRSRE